MSRSHKSARYGALAEKFARKKYGLEAEHDGRHDAIDDQGRPWDVKAAMLSRDDPRFRLWKDQHSYLSREGGGHIFVAYIPRGSGIQVARSKAVLARDLRVTFYGAGGHREGTPQVKVPVGRIF